MKLVRVPVVWQMTIFERQLILLPAVTPQTELVYPTQFDYDRRAHVRASARRAPPATRARCRGTHCAPHSHPSPPTEMHLRRVWAGWAVPMCAGLFLYLQEERMPPGLVCGEQQAPR